MAIIKTTNNTVADHLFEWNKRNEQPVLVEGDVEGEQNMLDASEAAEGSARARDPKYLNDEDACEETSSTQSPKRKLDIWATILVIDTSTFANR